MKVGLIGYGYWGKIIAKNLPVKPMICDPRLPEYTITPDEVFRTCSHVFIATPAETHYALVKKALQNKCHVFCEKPLTTSAKETFELYEEALKSKTDLYVDWIFTCNPAVREIKRQIDAGLLGDLSYASMNRMNLGPVRHDVSARFDLSSHDVSILSYFIEQQMESRHWEYISSESTKAGTTCSEITWATGKAVINASWNYPVKNRTCVFSFEHATVHWDDMHGFLYVNGKNITLEDTRSPLEISINEFLSDSFDKETNKRVTLEVSNLLENTVIESKT